MPTARIRLHSSPHGATRYRLSVSRLLSAPDGLPQRHPPVMHTFQKLQAGQHFVHGRADHHDCAQCRQQAERASGLQPYRLGDHQ